MDTNKEPIKGAWINAETGEPGISPKFLAQQSREEQYNLFNVPSYKRRHKRESKEMAPYLDIISEKDFNNVYMDVMNNTDLIKVPINREFDDIFLDAFEDAKTQKFLNRPKQFR